MALSVGVSYGETCVEVQFDTDHHSPEVLTDLCMRAAQTLLGTLHALDEMAEQQHEET
jgi:hypothetical protein